MTSLAVVHGLLGAPGSIVVVQGFSCLAACGILLDQGSNPCILHWQVDSLPRSQQGNPGLEHLKSSLPRTTEVPLVFLSCDITEC